MLIIGQIEANFKEHRIKFDCNDEAKGKNWLCRIHDFESRLVGCCLVPQIIVLDSTLYRMKCI